MCLLPAMWLLRRLLFPRATCLCLAVCAVAAVSTGALVAIAANGFVVGWTNAQFAKGHEIGGRGENNNNGNSSSGNGQGESEDRSFKDPTVSI
jgi:hypothetical protein